ncbi:G protein gamma domain-containing protein [Aphelenchoides bicaudatus]|nr:G protein gamma domain-containing protein [Aphelenchoides bicaudatus]
MSGRDLQNAEHARKVVEQLRREKNLQRLKVSTAAAELCKYVHENEKDDYLLNGFPTDKMNPYRPKNQFQCMVL